MDLQNSSALEFKKLKSQKSFAKVNKSSFTEIQKFCPEYGLPIQHILDPGTYFTKKFLVTKDAIKFAKNSFLLLIYKVYSYVYYYYD